MLPRTTTFSRIWNLPPATLNELRREFDNAMGTVGDVVSRTCSTRLPVSIWESAEKLVVEVDVPGFRQSDLDVTVDDGILTIAGERRPSQHAGELKHSDCRCGEFSRSIQLHESLDPTSVSAELENGVLTLEIARRVEAQPRKVPVEVRVRTEESAAPDAASSEGE